MNQQFAITLRLQVENRINLIKTLNKTFDLGLKEAKKFADTHFTNTFFQEKFLVTAEQYGLFRHYNDLYNQPIELVKTETYSELIDMTQ